MGRYFLQLPSGNYEVKVEAEGFVPQTIQKQVKIGVKSRLTVTMERVPAPVVLAPVVPAPVGPAPVAIVAPQQQPIIAAAQPVNLTEMVEGVMGQVENGVH